VEKLLTALASITLITLLVMILSRRHRGDQYGQREQRPGRQECGELRGGKPEPELNGKHCPLCGSALYRGESVKSVLYPKSGGAPDRLMEIHGCPHCYPPPGKEKRICPVCKKMVPLEGDVVARVFDKQERRHVHVLGCSRCYRRQGPPG